MLFVLHVTCHTLTLVRYIRMLREGKTFLTRSFHSSVWDDSFKWKNHLLLKCSSQLFLGIPSLKKNFGESPFHLNSRMPK